MPSDTAPLDPEAAEDGSRPVQLRPDADGAGSGRRPHLGDDELLALGRYGSKQTISEGEILFSEGDARYDLIVVLSGSIRLISHYGKPGKEQAIVDYGPREFMGEIGMLTGQRVFLTALVTGDGCVLRVPIERVRDLMS